MQVQELTGDNAIVRQKALLAARDLLTSPVNLVQCVAAGATSAIVALLQVRHSCLLDEARGGIRPTSNPARPVQTRPEQGALEHDSLRRCGGASPQTPVPPRKANAEARTDIL